MDSDAFGIRHSKIRLANPSSKCKLRLSLCLSKRLSRFAGKLPQSGFSIQRKIDFQQSLIVLYSTAGLQKAEKRGKRRTLETQWKPLTLTLN